MVEIRCGGEPKDINDLDVHYVAQSTLLELYEVYEQWWDELGNGESPASQANTNKTFLNTNKYLYSL